MVPLAKSAIAGSIFQDVARRLGVSLPTVQRHVVNKDDLSRACVEEVLDQVLICVGLDRTEVGDIDDPVSSVFLPPHLTCGAWAPCLTRTGERL